MVAKKNVAGVRRTSKRRCGEFEEPQKWRSGDIWLAESILGIKVVALGLRPLGS